jgi:hypothetical protein
MRYKVRVSMDVELSADFRTDAEAAQRMLCNVPLAEYLGAAYCGVNISGEASFSPTEAVAVIIEEQ